jgi:hypothetical protein
MKFRVDGVELDASHMRVREVCEAEKTLGLDMSESGIGGKTAVALFIAMRRADPAKPVPVIAEEVLSADMTTFEEIEDELPPTPTKTNFEPGGSSSGFDASDGESDQALESPPTSGPLLSVPSE